jgi:hypothetical protein
VRWYKLVESLEKKINLELENIDKLFLEAKPLFDLCKLRLPDFVEASAAALILHSFYNGIENILLLIAKNYNETTSGVNWHTQLFENAFQKTEKHTNIFTDEIKAPLKEYLTFRHFIRHAYAYSIDAVRMKPLIQNVELTWATAKENIKAFVKDN